MNAPYIPMYTATYVNYANCEYYISASPLYRRDEQEKKLKSTRSIDVIRSPKTFSFLTANPRTHATLSFA